jgi:hypothetical protein
MLQLYPFKHVHRVIRRIVVNDSMVIFAEKYQVIETLPLGISLAGVVSFGGGLVTANMADVPD